MSLKSESVYTCMMCKKKFTRYPKYGICDQCGTNINTEKNKLVILGEKKMVLIKISDEKAIDSMNAGTFWFQSPKYYQNFARNDAIGDVNECAFESILEIPLNELEKYSRKIKGEIFEKDGNKYCFDKVLNGIVYVKSVYQNCFRLLCFYMLELDEDNKIIKPDKKMKLFGTHFSIIKNRMMLEEKIKKYIENADYSLSGLATPIAYIKDKYRGVYTPGCKFENYSYQNEYRIILESEKYDKMPEEEKKVVDLQEEDMDKIMTKPIPIEKLWTATMLEELLE